MSEYTEDRIALMSLFPRGRCTRDEENHCVLTARQANRRLDFVYVQDPNRKLGIFYVGNGRIYRNVLRDLIIDEIEADGEGILHVRWVPEVAKRLPWFSKRRATRPQWGWFVKKTSPERGSGVSQGVPLSSTQGGGLVGCQTRATRR